VTYRAFYGIGGVELTTGNEIGQLFEKVITLLA